MLIAFIVTTSANARIVEIIDGDTVRVKLSRCITVDEEMIICGKIKVRLHDIDTPEIHGKCEYEKHLASLAKDYLIRFLKNGDIVALSQIELDKYSGRIVANMRTKQKVDVSGEMLRLGFAHSYNGKGKRREWCKQ